MDIRESTLSRCLELALIAGAVAAGTLVGSPALADTAPSVGSAVAVVAAATTSAGQPAAAGILKVADHGDVVTATAGADGAGLSVDDAGGTKKLGSAAVVDLVGSSQVVFQPVDAGVRAAYVLNNPSDPTSFDTTVTGVASLVANPDGSLTAVDASDRPVGMVEAPWARDADGRPVPTSFAIKGTTITQTVDTSAGGYAYPITADPKLTFGTRIYWSLTRSEQKYFLTMSAGAAAALLCGDTAGLACAAAAAAAAGIGQWVGSHGICPKSSPWLQIGFPYGYPINPYPGISIACKKDV